MENSTLSHYAEIVMGQSPPGEACNTVGRGLPLLNGPTEYGPHHPTPVQFTTDAHKQARAGDILFCVRGSTTGRMNWADREYAIGRGVAAIRHKKGSDLQPFVRAVIEYGLPSLLAQATGSTFPNVSANQLAGLWWPPLDESGQRSIAQILGTLDDKIELNRRMNETLEAIARVIFKAWFVDFDPVRAKKEGRWHKGESLPDLPTHLYDLFPAHLVDSELGEVPARWAIGSIYDIADVVYGAPFSSAQFNTEGIGEPLVRIRDLASESPGVWTPEAHPKGYKVRPGDIVVGMDGEFRAHLWGGVEAWLNQRVCVFVPKGDYSPAFVRNSITEPLAHVEATETATTVIHLGKCDIDLFSAVVPTAPVLAAFNHFCQPCYDRIIAGKLESRTLADLRNTLLPKLISGEMRVKDAERFVAGGAHDQ